MIFNLNQKVKITTSGEEGEVIGRAEYATSEPCYLLRYMSADKCARESWWQESALDVIAPPDDYYAHDVIPF